MRFTCLWTWAQLLEAVRRLGSKALGTCNVRGLGFRILVRASGRSSSSLGFRVDGLQSLGSRGSRASKPKT